MTTPGKPVFGAGVLRYPQIMSPNFDLANPAASPANSWALLQNGLAYLFGVVLSGGTITGPDYIINTSGAFFYAATPAAGNLVKSIASLPGTDAFGNSYLAGDVSYSSVGSPRQAGQLSADGLIMYTALTEAGPWSQVSSVIWATGLAIDDESLNGIAIGAAFGVPVTIGKHGNPVTVAGPVTATDGTQANPTLITTDTDHAITSFSNGWGNNGVCRAAVLPMGFTGKNMVYVEVNMTVGGVVANGTTTCTLPAGIPLPTGASSFFDVGTQGGTAMTNAPYMQITTGGNIQIFSLPTNATSVRGWKTYPVS
jgi:hypothetical protein